MARWDRVIRSRRRSRIIRPGVCLSGASAPRNGLAGCSPNCTELLKGGGSVFFGPNRAAVEPVVEMRTSRCSGTPARSEPGQPDSSPRGTVGRGGPVGCRKVNLSAAADCSCPPAVNCVCLTNHRPTCGWTRPIRRTCGWCSKPRLVTSLTVEENVGFPRTGAALPAGDS